MTESEDIPSMDVYIRLNEDSERDYCFNVPRDQPLRQLMDIFTTLPMVLSPSYFYNSKPVGFAASTHPGFLTSEGALLFDYDSSKPKYLRPLDLDKPIKDQVWEGQLIVPLWEYNYRRWLTLMSLLGGWLYMDLPQYITPTPGIAPFVVLMRQLEFYFPILKDESPSGEMDTPAWQWGFFGFHVLKVVVIYLIFWFGGINPESMNPLINRRISKEREISKEKLLTIGWTSSRRATPSEWREENRKAKIERAGGVVAAYQAGLLNGIGDAGVRLGDGEGWASGTPTEPVQDLDDDRKFVLSQQYLMEVYATLAPVVTDPEISDEARSNVVKAFRRSGPDTGTEHLRNLYDARKDWGDGTIKPDSVKIVRKDKEGPKVFSLDEQDKDQDKEKDKVDKKQD